MECRCRDDPIGHVRKRFTRNTSESHGDIEIERSNPQRTVRVCEGSNQSLESFSWDSFLLDEENNFDNAN